MKYFVFIVCATFAFILSTVEGIDCDFEATLVYEDLGCVPINGNPDDPCPTHYDCSHIKKDGLECHTHGRTYPAGGSIDPLIQEQTCNEGCTCSDKGGKATIECPYTNCTEWFEPHLENGCIRQYDIDSCCSIGEICPPFTNIATCVTNGKTYREGQRMHFGESCNVCICHSGFRGVNEAPFCRRRTCAVEIEFSDNIENNCAPVYKRYQQNIFCCPDYFICDDQNDEIQPAPTPSEYNVKCKFGERELGIRDTFSRAVNKYTHTDHIACECHVPPLVTCIEN